VRHRIEASATVRLPAEIYATLRAAVQLNQFLDPLLITGDVGTLLTIEDENRNSVLVHAVRDIGAHWAVEARYAFYANEFATKALTFRRQTFYAGLVYDFGGGSEPVFDKGADRESRESPGPERSEGPAEPTSGWGSGGSGAALPPD